MDNFQLWRREKKERCSNLLSKFPSEVERNSSEVGVPEQVIQVVGEELEHQAQVVPPHEVVLQLDHMVLVIRVCSVHHLEQFVFYLSLLQERLLVLDNFDRHLTLLNFIVSFDYLTEGTFPNETINFVPKNTKIIVFKCFFSQKHHLIAILNYLSKNFSPCFMM